MFNSIVRDTPSGFNGWVPHHAFGMANWNVPMSQAAMSAWGMTQYRDYGDGIARAHRAASENYRLVHGKDGPYFFDIWDFIREYSHIPTLEELAAKTADLSRRIDAAKAKHGVA